MGAFEIDIYRFLCTFRIASKIFVHFENVLCRFLFTFRITFNIFVDF